MRILLMILLCCLATWTPAEDTRSAPVPAPDTIAYIHIDEMIDGLQQRYVQRAIADAEAAGATIILTRISSFGGLVTAGYEISQAFLKVQDRGIRTIAFVDGHAISAGAMIAYAHQEIHLTDNSTIGDIGVIFQGPDGEIKMAPEKYESFVREFLGTVAEKNNWNSAIIRKMTAIGQDLYEIRQTPGEPATYDYVLSSRLDHYLADHPDLDRDDKTRVLVRWPEGELITLGATHAVELGMATAHTSGFSPLLESLGTTEEALLDLRKTGTEQLADALSGWAPVLAALALLFIFFELKTPGVGIFAILGGICGALFFISQFYLDLASHLELVLVLTGVILLAVELLTLWGGGLIGVLGAGLALSGLLLAFMPDNIQFDPAADQFLPLLGNAALQTAYTAGVLAIGLSVIAASLPHLAAQGRFGASTSLSGSSAGELERQADTLHGRVGRCLCDLRPAGTIDLDGRSMSAQSRHGRPIARGTQVRICGMRFGEALVETIDESTDTLA